MSFLKKLFGGGGGSAPDAPKEDYNGYHITLTPISESDGYRVCALIEKEIEGELKTHKMVRADTVQGLEAAQAASLRKAQQVIDEQGDRIFTPR